LRSPAWMVAYAVTLLLLGAAYVALVFFDRGIAFVFALAALVTVLVALVLALKR
jgi:hypothetical protein